MDVYLGAFFKFLQFYFNAINPFSLSFSMPISYSKTVLFPLHSVVNFSLNILRELEIKYSFGFFSFRRVLFCLYCLARSRYCLSLLSFASIFLSIFSSSIANLVSCCFFFFQSFISLCSSVFFHPKYFLLFL